MTWVLIIVLALSVWLAVRPSRSSRKARELSWTAHHEAAHAVVCLRLRPDASFGVTIIRSGSTLGAFSCEDPLDSSGQLDESTGDWIPDVQTVEAGIVKLLAGYFGAIRAGSPAAQAKRGADSDGASISRCIKYARQTRDKLQEVAMQVIEREWNAITVVGQELLAHGRLDAEEVEILTELPQSRDTRIKLATYRQGRTLDRHPGPVPEKA